jgi:hypothetical protein
MQPSAVLSKGSKETSSVPKNSLSAEQMHNLPRRWEAHPLILADENTAKLPPTVSNDFHTPNEANRAHSVSVAKEMSMSRLIVLKPPAPNSTPWNPGIQGLYPRPKGPSLHLHCQTEACSCVQTGCSLVWTKSPPYGPIVSGRRWISTISQH